MIIIGIDPGLTKTGVGIIEYKNNSLAYIFSDTIYSSTKDHLSERLNHFHKSLTKIIADFNPQIAAIEETFINTNPLSSLKLGHVRGALMLSLSIAKIPVFEYSTTAIKKAIVGKGRADKRQIQMMVNVLLPKVSFQTEDEADAIAAAICHCNNRAFKFN